MDNGTPNGTPKPDPRADQARLQAIVEAGNAAMILLANHAAMQGVGVTIVVAAGDPPLVLNTMRAEIAAQLLPKAVDGIAEQAKQNGPVLLVDSDGLDPKRLRGMNN